ncbi:MAG: hypothetical protein IPM55_09245 [Acidobacteria bacterium]|nr:hypothetical protein [Acidobacteriota bacterium]
MRSYINFTANAAVGVRASDGKLMWRYANVANRVAIAQRRFLPTTKSSFSL